MSEGARIGFGEAPLEVCLTGFEPDHLVFDGERWHTVFRVNQRSKFSFDFRELAVRSSRRERSAPCASG
jgi:hypothetical protein